MGWREWVEMAIIRELSKFWQDKGFYVACLWCAAPISRAFRGNATHQYWLVETPCLICRGRRDEGEAAILIDGCPLCHLTPQQWLEDRPQWGKEVLGTAAILSPALQGGLPAPPPPSSEEHCFQRSQDFIFIEVFGVLLGRGGWFHRKSKIPQFPQNPQKANLSRSLAIISTLNIMWYKVHKNDQLII